MLCKAFKFGRLATSQFDARQQQLNDFLNSVDVLGLPQVTACDEDGPVMFVFYTNKQAEFTSKEEFSAKEKALTSTPKLKKD